MSDYPPDKQPDSVAYQDEHNPTEKSDSGSEQNQDQDSTNLTDSESTHTKEKDGTTTSISEHPSIETNQSFETLGSGLPHKMSATTQPQTKKRSSVTSTDLELGLMSGTPSTRDPNSPTLTPSTQKTDQEKIDSLPQTDEETTSEDIDELFTDTTVDERSVLEEMASLVSSEPRTVLELHKKIGNRHNLSRDQVEYRLDKLADHGIINSKKGPGRTSPRIFWTP